MMNRGQGRAGRDHAVRVESVERDTPAATAGVEPGDLIVALDGRRVEGIDDLHRLLTADLVGRAATITVVRRTTRLDLAIVPVER